MMEIKMKEGVKLGMKNKFAVIFALTFSAIAFSTYAAHMQSDKLRLVQTCYVEDEGIRLKMSEPILLENDLGCDNQIQTICVEGDIDVIAFTRENGFTYQEGGVVETNGFVPCMFISKQDTVQGKIHIFQDNGEQRDFDVIQEGEDVVISRVK